MENIDIADRQIIKLSISNPYANTSFDESKMEVVKAFNNELVSLYDIKPPISKAKMTAITKAAMKSVKFYKHVVHGVEKFILKCRPDYKIPGLYVIDSIVRQSRHQFGNEKDVFAPRFSKNLLQTFKNICLCPEEDKQKLVRVINLWQKHKVFPEDLLKKFLVMVEAGEEDLPELYKDEIEAIQKSSKKSPSSCKKKKKSPIKSVLDAVTTPLQNSYYSASTPNNSGMTRPSGTYNDKKSVDPNFLQTLATLLQQSNAPPVNTSPVTSVISSNADQLKFDKKLLDYDYGEEDEEMTSNQVINTSSTQPIATESLNSILMNPDLMRQIQNLQFQLSMAHAHQVMSQAKQHEQASLLINQQKIMQSQQTSYNQVVMQQQYQVEGLSSFMNSAVQDIVQFSSSVNPSDDDLDDNPEIVMEKHASEPLEVIDLDRIPTPPSDRSNRRSYSRSLSRSSSRSRSRSRRRRSRRSRSRSWNRERSRDREKNNERRRKALPPIKRKYLAVCSTTLWVGHLSKLVQEQDLSDTFGQYGDIVSIDLIPPRGCAFLCMNRRQDADKALHKLKNTKIHGKPITIAWAPGKGMKGREWKDYWEVDYGVSYIPWCKLTKDTDYDLLEEGGMLDPESFPEWLKIHLEDKRKISYSSTKSSSKAMYTPSGTDMDESDNDDDNGVNIQHDVLIEPANGVSEQMIPLPDGPQPNADIPSGLGIPLPPGQNTVPPPSVVHPFGLAPRLLGPIGVLGGNFIPPLGVPPPVPGLLMSPQSIVNRLPPPYPGPAGVPLLNPGPASNTSLSQIPLPDSNLVPTTSQNSFKPSAFGPPLLFPGNPNIKIDLPRNQAFPGLRDDDANIENSSFSGPFNNFGPPNTSNRNLQNEDTDYRILGDISNATNLNNSNNSNGSNQPMDDNATHNKSEVDDDVPLNENDRDRFRKFQDRGRHFDNDRNRFSDRNHRFGGRSLYSSGSNLPTNDNVSYNKSEVIDKLSSDHDRDRFNKFQDLARNVDNDRNRLNDKHHRFGERSPYREISSGAFDNNRRDNYGRRNRYDRDYDGDSWRGGRNFRSRSRDTSNVESVSRFRGRSPVRDRFRDNRRDFPDDKRRECSYEKHDLSRERSSEDQRSSKRSRWTDAITAEEKWPCKPSNENSTNNQEWSSKQQWSVVDRKDSTDSEPSPNEISTDNHDWSNKPTWRANVQKEFSNFKPLTFDQSVLGESSKELKWYEKLCGDSWDIEPAQKEDDSGTNERNDIDASIGVLDEFSVSGIQIEPKMRKSGDVECDPETNKYDRGKEDTNDKTGFNSEQDVTNGCPERTQSENCPESLTENLLQDSWFNTSEEDAANKIYDDIQNESTVKKTSESYSDENDTIKDRSWDENRNDYMDVESIEDSHTEFESTHIQPSQTKSLQSSGENSALFTEPPLPEVPMAPILRKPTSVNSNKFDMFAEDPEPAELSNQSAEEVVTDVPNFRNTSPSHMQEERSPVQNRMLLMGHETSPLMLPFGSNTPSSPFSGMPTFQRLRFPGQRPYPPCFQSVPRQFSLFKDSRPPRYFMPSRSNNF